MVQATIRTFGRQFWNLRIRHANRVPRRGGVIIASNHQSFLDPPLVGSCLQREICYMARRTLFEIPVLGRLIRMSNAFPVDRESADIKSMKTAINLLRNGEALLVFPEGTRSEDGSLGRLKPGIRILAARANVPVVPVLIQGAHCVWPKGRRFPRLRGRMDIVFGKPFRVSGGDEEISTTLHDAMIALKEDHGEPETREGTRAGG